MRDKKNSYYIFTDKNQLTHVDEFVMSIVDLGENMYYMLCSIELSRSSIRAEKLSISAYVPWLTSKCNTDYTTAEINTKGTKTEIPLQITRTKDQILTATIDLNDPEILGDFDNIKINMHFNPAIPLPFKKITSANGVSLEYKLMVNDRLRIPKDVERLLKNRHLCYFKEFQVLSILSENKGIFNANWISSASHVSTSIGLISYNLHTGTHVRSDNPFSFVSIKPYKRSYVSQIIQAVLALIVIVSLAIVFASEQNSVPIMIAYNIFMCALLLLVNSFFMSPELYPIVRRFSIINAQDEKRWLQYEKENVRLQQH